QPRAVEFKARHHSRTRPGGNNDAVESQVLLAASPALSHFQRSRIHECGFAPHELDLALFRKLSKSAGELVNYAGLPIAKFVEVNFGRGEFDAPVLGLLGFFK